MIYIRYSFIYSLNDLFIIISFLIRIPFNNKVLEGQIISLHLLKQSFKENLFLKFVSIREYVY